MTSVSEGLARAREDKPWNIACSYGAHQFVREEWAADDRYRPGLHAHRCTACDATYMALDPCWCKPKAATR